MQLSNCELLPGVIVDTKDPEKLGRIKCVIPGYVDASFSNENMPWIRPLGMFNHQSFSKMMKGYKVWVLVNKVNYNEFWYFPFFELNDVAKAYLDPVYDDEQPEVLVAHNCGGNHATLTYDESNGYSEKIGNHHIDLHPDGKIELLGQQGTVLIDGSNLTIGKNTGTSQPATLGKSLYNILSGLKEGLALCQSACGNAPFLSPLIPGFEKCVNNLNNIESILSSNITLMDEKTIQNKI